MLKANTYNALLTAGSTVDADESGSAIAILGPTGIGSNWYPVQVAVSSTSVSNATGQLYQGPTMPQYAIASILNSSSNFLQQIGGTYTANNNSIGFVSNLTIPFGQSLIFQWLGADNGSQCALTVTGTQTATYWR